MVKISRLLQNLLRNAQSVFMKFLRFCGILRFCGLNKFTQRTAFGLILAVFVLAAFTILGLTAVNLMSQQSTTYINNLNYIKSHYLAIAAKNYAYESYLQSRYNFADLQTLGTVSKTIGSGSFSITLSDIPSGQSLRVHMVFRGTTPIDATHTYYYQMNQDFAINGSYGLNIPLLFQDFQAFLVYLKTDSNNAIMLVGNWSWPDCVGSNIFGNIAVKIPSAATLQLMTICPGQCGTAPQIGPASITPPGANIYTTGNLSVETPVGDPKAVYGKAYAGGNISTNSGEIAGTQYPNSSCNNWPNNRCPTFPPINTTYFDKLIYTATSKGRNPTAFTWTNPTNLSGRNLFFNGDVTIPANYVVNGPGAIIATGTVTVGVNAQVGERISIIAAGKIYIAGPAYDFTLPISYTVLGGTWNETAKVIEGKGVVLYSPTGIISTSVGGCSGSGCPAANIVIKGTLLFPNGIGNVGHGHVNSTLFGIYYAPAASGWYYYLTNTVYGNVFDSVCCGDCITYQIVKNYKDIPYPGGSREEIPLEIKGLYAIPRTALQPTQISF